MLNIFLSAAYLSGVCISFPSFSLPPHAGDGTIGSSASPRHVLSAKSGTVGVALKVIVEFSRALERTRRRGCGGKRRGEGGKDLNPQDVGLVASRRIVTTLKTSVVTFEAEEEAAAGEWDELLRNGICREFLHRLSIHLHCYFDACLIERFVRGFFSSAPCMHPHAYPFLV